jgi:hypothetical protein
VGCSTGSSISDIFLKFQVTHTGISKATNVHTMKKLIFKI